jgi:glycosyltransferase involved in cell wall biosynthesis
MVIQKPQRRGAEVFALQLAEALEARGSSTRVVALYEQPAAKALALRPTDVPLGFREASRAEKIPGVQGRLLRRLRDEVRAFSPDVVQVNGARTIKYGALLRRLTPKAPWALIYRNIDSPKFWNTRPLIQALYRRLFIQAMDGVVGVSEATLAEVRAMYALQVPSRYIPRAIDTNHIAPAGVIDVAAKFQLQPNHHVLLFVGQLAPQKRPERFIEIVSRLRADGHAVVGLIVGDGPLRASLEADVARRAAAAWIRFAGFQEHVGDLYRAASLLLLTSDTEGTPGVVLEAGACGVAAVAADVGGVRECIDNGKSGVIVAAADIDAYVAAVAALLVDDVARAAMGDAARAVVDARFSLPRIVDAYDAFYAQVIGSGTRE